jgi:hypothetical protein
MNAINCLGCIRSQDLYVILLQGLKFLAPYNIQDLCVILFEALEFLSQYKIRPLAIKWLSSRVISDNVR